MTGGIAEGKSTVVGFLSDLGLTVWSADEVVRELWAQPDLLRQICDALDLPMEAPRTTIHEKIATSVDARRMLNAFFHPLIYERMMDARAQVYEVPLLIEACLHPLFEQVWVVTCGEEEQSKRLLARFGNSVLADSVRRIHLPTRAKCAFADKVIRTNCPLSNVKLAVNEAAIKTFGL